MIDKDKTHAIPRPAVGAKPLGQSMTVRSAALTVVAFLAAMVAKWSGAEVPAGLTEAIVVVGGAAVAIYMRRGVEASRVGR